MLQYNQKFVWMQALTTNSVLTTGKSAIPPLFNRLEVLSSVSDKEKLFAETFSKNSNLDNLISLAVFPSRINMKLNNISVTPKMVKNVITNAFIYQRHLVLTVFQWWF